MDGDELYGLPLDRFVPARAELAKSLRAAGRRDDAKAVVALRKPSIAAWAVNQLVRTRHREIQSLFESGDELRAAQSGLLEGQGDPGVLRSAGERERAIVAELVGVARGLLTSEGNDLSAATLERVSDTLHAAALDEEARELVRDGRLERELRHVGLGLGLGTGLGEQAPAGARGAAPPAGSGRASAKVPKDAAPTGPDPKAASRTDAATGDDDAEARSSGETQGRRTGASPAQRRAERERAAAERDEAERTRREARARRAAARASVAAARRRALAAARVVETAEEQRRRAAQALEDADEVVAAARRDAATADEALERAEAELGEA